MIFKWPVITLLCVFFALPLSAAVQPVKTRNVLVLHSYHKGLEWTDGISAGIQSVLEPDEDNDIEIYNEYLDTKRNPGEEYYVRLCQFERQKTQLANIAFDVIITSDNDALRFMAEYGDELFPGTPVVFCGVNNFHLDLLKGKSNFTGVSEYVDYEATLDLMVKLHPERNRVLAIVDQTSTGMAIKEELNAVIPKFADQIEVEYFQDFLLDEIESKISQLGPEDLIYILAFNRDRNNHFISYADVIRRIHRAATVPIYGSWDFFFGKGIVGGMITSGFLQGEQAARLAQRILDGERVRDIPIITQSPNQYMFDDEELVRFGIQKSHLPPDSVLINEPPGFFEIHRQLLFIYFYTSLGILLVLSVYLILQRRKRLRLEKANRELDRRVEKQTLELKQKNVQLREEITVRQQAETVLVDKTQKLEKALSEVNALSGLLPICASCKKIRDDQGYWSQIEIFITEHSDVDFSHGICPDCFKELYPEYEYVESTKASKKPPEG